MGFARTKGSSTRKADNSTLCRQLVSFWDESGNPKDISDLAKLFGTGIGTRGTVIVDTFLRGSRTTKFADGYHGTRAHGSRQMNPLNFVLRLHSKDGRGVKSAWGIRRVVDHQHKDFKRENLSTMVLNACDRVVWAWDHDLERVVTVRGRAAKLDDKELHFSDSGHLPIVSGKGKRRTVRGIRTLNLAKNAGSMSDGDLIAGLWHVLHLGRRTKGITKVEGECAIVDATDGLLRGEVEYAVFKKKAHLAIEDKKYPKLFGRPLVGHLWIDDEPMPAPPANELKRDKLSNQVELLRVLHKSLRVVVFDEVPWTPTPPRVPVPPDWPGVPTPRSPRRTTSGEFPVDSYEAKGKNVATFTNVPIPTKLNDDFGMRFRVNFITPRALGGFQGDVDLKLEYVSIKDGDAALTALTGTLDKTVDAAGFPNPYIGVGAKESFEFFVPAKDLRGREGGKVATSFIRSGTDDQLDDFDLVGMEYAYAPEATEIP